MTSNLEVPETEERETEQLWKLVDCRCPTKSTGLSASQECDEEACAVHLDSSSSGGTEAEAKCDEEEESIWDKMEKELLTAKDNDPLIPSHSQINSAWQQGWTTWSTLLSAAESLLPNEWPVACLDPSIMLHSIPPLPPRIPSDKLAGQPTWRVSHIDHPSKEVNGAKRNMCLGISKPIPCRISQQPESFHYGKTIGTPSTDVGSTPKALSVLVLCWSYILSARLLELQGRRVHFSEHHLQPTITPNPGRSQELTVHLPPSTSPGLVRWLCAVLAPAPGWTTDTASNFPPWASFCSGPALFVIQYAHVISFRNSKAPTSLEALAYLAEFIDLYELGPEPPWDSSTPQQHKPIAPYTAGFLAALALPFYDIDDLEPQLPAVSLKGPRPLTTTPRPTADTRQAIEQYYNDLPYYMTLSLNPRAVGSMVWSIFWQPGIPCNLVSPWLGSILEAIKPLLEARDLSGLAKVFLLRRPKVSLLWLGIFLLGDPTMLDRIERYLTQLEERRFYGSLAAPDSTVASWTGSPQSFWDEEEESTMAEKWSEVPRANVLRRRQILRIQDDRWHLFSWEPFGPVARKDIEPELLEQFETPYLRQYSHWTWLVPGENVRVECGFREDTGRPAMEPSQNSLELLPSSRPMEFGTIRLAPSRKATLSMLHFSIHDTLNDRSLDIAGIPGLKRDHVWLEEWRGLEG
ncbi:hypothetical protein F5Y16DRAFT_391198 [Xylariaceae sp. FL0255]|nr:hypothetical protein F5Y16DRAFT_391198 [Xylariaceae sp. FL0255]